MAGDLVEWVAAAGSLGAAVIPLVFFFRERANRQEADRRRDVAEAARSAAEDEYRSTVLALQQHELERQIKRQHAEEQERARAQADLVHVWMDPKELEVVYCMNASSQPTGNLMVTVVLTFVDNRATPPGFLPVLASQKLILWLDQLPPTGNRPAGRSLRELHPFAIEGPEGFELGGVQICPGRCGTLAAACGDDKSTSRSWLSCRTTQVTADRRTSSRSRAYSPPVPLAGAAYRWAAALTGRRRHLGRRALATPLVAEAA